MNIGRVFGATSVLRPVDRFELGLVVTPADRLFPLTDEEFEALPGPQPGATTRQFLARLVPAVRQTIDGPLASWQLSDVVPALDTLNVGVETTPGVTNRLLALVRSNGRRRWSDLAACTISEIRSWNGAGLTLTARLIIAAVESAMDASPNQSNDSPSTDLGVTIRHAGHTHPSSRRDVATVLVDCLSVIGDKRARVAFELDDLRFDHPFGNDSTGHRRTQTAELIRIGPERVRQLKMDARHHAVRLLEADTDVRNTIGTRRAPRQRRRPGEHRGRSRIARPTGCGPSCRPAGRLPRRSAPPGTRASGVVVASPSRPACRDRRAVAPRRRSSPW